MCLLSVQQEHLCNIDWVAKWHLTLTEYGIGKLNSVSITYRLTIFGLYRIIFSHSFSY